MSEIRKIQKIWRSKPTMEGAGVHLSRAFGFKQTEGLDPFLLFDDFRNDKRVNYFKGFPWHPHRGIETITYMLRGDVEHGDSLGNKGIISSGDVQWMTAGSGIIHQEMPKGDNDEYMWGFQLWANLPASHKMMDPRYQEIKSSEIPEIDYNGAKIKIICGEVNGVKGPVKDIITEPEYLDITVPKGTNFTHKIKRGKNVFAYIIDGEGYFDPTRDPYDYDVEGQNYFDFDRKCVAGNKKLVLYGDGDEISVTTLESSVRFLLISGNPLNEPVAWYGPIVMNTREELKIAFDEYRNGTFIKYKNK